MGTRTIFVHPKRPRLLATVSMHSLVADRITAAICAGIIYSLGLRLSASWVRLTISWRSMVKSIVASCLILLTCKASVGLDDYTTLAMLKSAHAEHVASWSSGKMRFVSKADHPGHQCVDVSGELEWSKDFVYFFGERTETHESGLSAGVIKRSIQILRAVGEVAALIHLSEESHQSDSMYLFPDDGGRHNDGVIPLMPDYQWFLFSLSPLQKSDFALIIRPDDSAENDRVVRTISTGQNTVTIRSSFKRTEGGRDLVFRLDAGGLCESMKSTQHVRDGMQFEHVTRTWHQSTDGRWFPETSEQVARMGSESATPYFHYTLTISECGPLDHRSISTTPSLTVFGPLPESVRIGTRGPNGKMVFEDVSAARPPEFEDQLRQQADKIRGTGFSAGRTK